MKKRMIFSKHIFFICTCITIPMIWAATRTTPKLPIGRSTFSCIIQDGNCYIDKTAFIYDLLKSDHRYFFIARPRQFGRTLFLTTLEALFNGEKDLFKKLAIAKCDYFWKKYPTIRLDFFGMATDNACEFEQRLCREIQCIAQKYNIVIHKEKTMEEQFSILIHELAKQYGEHSIVFLVDEYDKPLRDRINDQKGYKKIENVLKKLYDVVSNCDLFWHVVFFTGLTKCSKQNLFSNIHNLYDISEKVEGARLFGFSRKEILNNVKESLESYAQVQGFSLQQTLDFIEMWCGGYNFSSDLQASYLINPRSVAYHLHDERPDNYFFDGCTPSFLISLLKQQKYSFVLPEVIRIKISDFENYDLQAMLPEVALYATGYLSVCGIDKINNEFLLKIPNKEVAQSFQILKQEILKLQTFHFALT